MVVYADVLLVTNIIVTYFITLATAKISSTTIGIKRMVFASILGGVSSFFMFFPKQIFIVEASVKLLTAMLITRVAFRYENIKKYLRCVFSFFAVSFIYAGFMLGFWYVLKPAGMVINNGVVYFSISPIVLILSTVVCYFAISAARHFYRRDDANAERKKVMVFRSGNTFVFECIIDTGNTVSDTLSGRKIIILGKSAGREMFGGLTDSILSLNETVIGELKIRVIPYKTALGDGIMPIISVDGAAVSDSKIESVSVGILSSDFGDFDGIISPSFFD